MSLCDGGHETEAKSATRLTARLLQPHKPRASPFGKRAQRVAAWPFQDGLQFAQHAQRPEANNRLICNNRWPGGQPCGQIAGQAQRQPAAAVDVPAGPQAYADFTGLTGRTSGSSDFDPLLAVYTGTAVNALTAVASTSSRALRNDPSATVTRSPSPEGSGVASSPGDGAA